MVDENLANLSLMVQYISKIIKRLGTFDKDNVLEHMSNKESLLCDISLLYQRTTQILDSYSYSVLRANTFDLQESYKILQASLVQVGLLRQIRIS